MLLGRLHVYTSFFFYVDCSSDKVDLVVIGNPDMINDSGAV